MNFFDILESDFCWRSDCLYRYTGKERDEETGLYYHGARYYIPWLGRWTATDPLESKYAGMSPYNYSFNNPVIFNDPSGQAPEGGWYVDSAGNRYYAKDITTEKAFETSKYNKDGNSWVGSSSSFQTPDKKYFYSYKSDGSYSITNQLTGEAKRIAADGSVKYDGVVTINVRERASVKMTPGELVAKPTNKVSGSERKISGLASKPLTPLERATGIPAANVSNAEYFSPNIIFDLSYTSKSGEQQPKVGDERWMATDIMGTVSNGLMIPDGAFNFANTKTGKLLSMGGAHAYQSMPRVQQISAVRELQLAGKLAKPLTRGIAVVNFAATATAVTDDLYHSRYISAGARTAVWGLAAGATFIPVAGWGIAIGIGIADAIWGNDFYEYVEKKIANK